MPERRLILKEPIDLSTFIPALRQGRATGPLDIDMLVEDLKVGQERRRKWGATVLGTKKKQS